MGAFYHLRSLLGAVVNEGIRQLTWNTLYKSKRQDEVKGVFQDTGLRHITLPARLR